MRPVVNTTLPWCGSSLVSLVFSEDTENLKGEGIVRSIFDPCCGSGGMLTIGKEWIRENVNEDIQLRLVGQELNPQTFALCKWIYDHGEDPENIRLGNSLSEDRFSGDRYDYMITNPPYGVSWKSDKEFVENESENPNGRFSRRNSTNIRRTTFVPSTHDLKDGGKGKSDRCRS